jgi:hypothetical protein
MGLISSWLRLIPYMIVPEGRRSSVTSLTELRSASAIESSGAVGKGGKTTRFKNKVFDMERAELQRKM